MAQVVAGVFGIPIYILSPNALRGSQDVIVDLLSNIPIPAILLLDDIDCFGLTRPDQSPNKKSDDESKDGPQDNVGSAVSLYTLLNVLDGATAADGRLVIMTTNYRETLDEALTRPGRIDRIFHCPLASNKVARDMFYNLFGPGPEDTASSEARDGSPTGREPTLDKPRGQLAEHDALRLAEEFGKIMGGKTLSHAAIQNYCLRIKDDPGMGVKNAHKWKKETLATQSSE